MVVCSGLAVFGKTIDANTQSFLTDQIYQLALSAGAVVGGIFTIYGRVKANTKV